MVYTLTCNPSVEYIAEMENFTAGIQNRSKNERAFAGGKGVRMAATLRSLGVQCKMLGFLAGFTGDFIERELREMILETAFIRLEQGFSRINVCLKAQEESKICGSGPNVPPEAVESLLEQLDGLQKGDMLLLSGDAPPSTELYARILERLDGRGVYTIVDASGETLLKLLRRRPFLVKPNRQELEEFAGRRLFTRTEMIAEGRRMREMGAENVLISTAAEGAVLLSGDDVLYGEAPKGEAFHSAGAGDAMLAGFAAGWLQTGSFREALRLGIAAGSASVLCRSGASGEEIRRMYEENVVCGVERGKTYQEKFSS